MEEVIPQQGAKRTSSSLIPSIRTNTGASNKTEGWPITFRHLGKNGYELTLFASNQAARQKWLEFIDNSQQRLRSRADFFNTSCISSNYFVATNKVNCVAPFGRPSLIITSREYLLTGSSDGGRKLIIGTDSGIYVTDRKVKEGLGVPRKVLDAPAVTQIEILEEYQLLLVLSNKALLSYSLSALDPNEPALARRPKKIQNHCNYFKAGICLGRHLVCCVKSSALSTTIKVYEPNDAMAKKTKQKGLGKMFGAGQDELRPFKEFYIPAESTSVHFLKSKLCVACAKGFEVVSLETLETQSLLDQADTSLDFVARKDGVRPIHIERLNGEFLLNYSEFSLFVNKHGWRARPEWRIDWEGSPQSFALSYPWILAFEPNFIELRDIESGAVHIVPHKNIRMLHSSTHEVSFLSSSSSSFETRHVLTRNRSCLHMKTSGRVMSSSRLTFGNRTAGPRLSGRRRVRPVRAAAAAGTPTATPDRPGEFEWIDFGSEGTSEEKKEVGKDTLHATLALLFRPAIFFEGPIVHSKSAQLFRGVFLSCERMFASIIEAFCF